MSHCLTVPAALRPAAKKLEILAARPRRDRRGNATYCEPSLTELSSGRKRVRNSTIDPKRQILPSYQVTAFLAQSVPFLVLNGLAE